MVEDGPTSAGGGMLSHLVWQDGSSRWIFNDDSMSATLYDVWPIAGKGIGVVARTDLALGTLLMAERPLARLSKVQWGSRAQAAAELETVVNALSDEDRRRYFNLSQCPKHARAHGRARTAGVGFRGSE